MWPKAFFFNLQLKFYMEPGLETELTYNYYVSKRVSCLESIVSYYFLRILYYTYTL